jgi:Protein of unknown function (DUF3562)
MPDRTDFGDDVDHDAIISTIAQESHHPVPIVRRVYEAELTRLKESARITDYLVLFAYRRTRDALRAGQR